MGEPQPPSAPGDEGEPGVPQFKGRESAKALEKAVDAAFAGVDFADLERAWAKEILKIKAPPRHR